MRFFLLSMQSYDKMKPLANGFFLFARGFSLLCEGEFELNSSQKIECHSMIRRSSMIFNSLSMFLCRIACIMVPTIERELFVQFFHIIITIGLCQDGCRRNGEVLAITFHYGGVRHSSSLIRQESVSIDDQMFGPHFQAINGSMHRRDTGTKDVHLVNLLRRHDSQCPCHRITLNLVTQPIALLGGELFESFSRSL